MAAITWRNIAAPDFGAASTMAARAGDAFQGALQAVSGIAQQQENILESEKAANTQEALEAIQSIKDIDTYNKTSMEQLIGKYGSAINRKEVFNAFTGRDEQIWSEQDALQLRSDKNLLRESTGIIDNYISEAKLGNKPEEAIKDGFEALIGDYPAHIKAELRNKFTEQLNWENTLTPEGQRQYDIQAKKLQREFELIDKNTSEMIQEQQAIIGSNPMSKVSAIDAELSIAEYINKYAPDQFELDWSAYEGDDIVDAIADVKSNDVLKTLNARLPKGQPKFTSIPEQAIEFAIKTAIRTTDNKLRLGGFEDSVINAALDFRAYDNNARAAKENIRKLERQRTTAANTLYSGLEDVRKSVEARKNLLGTK